MPDILYSGQSISVSNKTTLDLAESVEDISPDRLFVSEPDANGQRYAFDIAEIEEYLTETKSLMNFYSKPKQPFSVNDLQALKKRSPIISNLIEQYFSSSRESLDKISPQTILQINLLSKRAGIFTQDKEFFESVRRRYSPEELAALESAGTSLQDIARGDAFARFKNYYKQMTETEKEALHQFPGVLNTLRMTGLSRFDDILVLKPESCLGGTAGACSEIAKSIAYMKSLLDTDVNIDVNERIFDHVQDERSISREKYRISPTSSQGMVVIFDFIGTITSKNINRSASLDEQIQEVKSIEPRGGADKWQAIFKKLLENDNRIAIVSNKLDPAVIKAYLKDVIGVPDQLLENIIIRSSAEKQYDYNRLIGTLLDETGNDKLNADRVWLIDDNQSNLYYAKRVGYSVVHADTENINDSSYLEKLKSGIAELQSTIFLPVAPELQAPEGSGTRTPYDDPFDQKSGDKTPDLTSGAETPTDISDMASERFESGKSNPAHSGTSTPVSGKGGQAYTTQLLEEAAKKLHDSSTAKVSTQSIYQSAIKAKHDKQTAQISIENKSENISTLKKPN